MKLIVTADKKLHFSAIGSVAEESWKNRQEEKLIVEIRDESGALITVDSGTLKVKLKATKSATTLLAQCTSFSVASAIYTGWLNLNTDACNALTQSKVLIEVSWEVSSHVQCSDDAEVYIIARTATGDEGDPETTSHLVTAQWLAAHILGGTGITITSDESAGTITIAGTLASQAEAEAGLLNTKLMTPLRVAQAIAALAAGGGTWGDITGTLADQADLQAALDAKLNTAWVDTFGPAPLDSPAFTTGATLGGVDIATINNIPNLSGYMQAANNLSDVASAATALGNLGFTITANGNLKLTVNGTDYYFLAVSSEP